VLDPIAIRPARFFPRPHDNRPNTIDAEFRGLTMEHTNKKYGQELSDLRSGLIRMGSIVTDQIDGALERFAAHDDTGARGIIERDAEVNRMDIELEEACLRLLALHQPAAIDLRLITAAMKITTELERIGDRVVNICEAIADSGTSDPASNEVLRIGKLAGAMVRDAMEAFSGNDASLVKPVLEKDKEFDRLYSHLFPNLLTSLAKDPERIARDAKLALLAKDLNEISEHATNIAEVVMFLVNGKEITHMDMHERRALTV